MKCRWVGGIRALEQGGKHALHESCAMLGPHVGKVAPDLAPAECTVRVFRAHEQHRPLVHRAERRDDRRCERVGENVRGQRAEAQRVAHRTTRSTSRFGG